MPLCVKIKDSFGVDVYNNVLVFKQFVVLRFFIFLLGLVSSPSKKVNSPEHVMKILYSVGDKTMTHRI